MNKKGFGVLTLVLAVFGVITIAFLSYSIMNSNNSRDEEVAGWSDFIFKSNRTTTQKGTGNSAPSGTHYNLNIIGVPKGKTADMTGSQGHRIFVPLAGSCKISLGEGEFAVLDGNCTDGQSQFQLPNPDPANTGTTVYSVWARALGKPGGKSTMTTCATDPLTFEEWCSVYPLVSMREKGKSTFTDVSRELLYIYVDLNADGVVERYNLFNSALQDYFWQYDNNGLKLLQLRFYPVSSIVD